MFVNVSSRKVGGSSLLSFKEFQTKACYTDFYFFASLSNLQFPDHVVAHVVSNTTKLAKLLSIKENLSATVVHSRALIRIAAC